MRMKSKKRMGDLDLGFRGEEECLPAIVVNDLLLSRALMEWYSGGNFRSGW